MRQAPIDATEQLKGSAAVQKAKCKKPRQDPSPNPARRHGLILGCDISHGSEFSVIEAEQICAHTATSWEKAHQARAFGKLTMLIAPLRMRSRSTHLNPITKQQASMQAKPKIQRNRSQDTPYSKPIAWYVALLGIPSIANRTPKRKHKASWLSAVSLLVKTEPAIDQNAIFFASITDAVAITAKTNKSQSNNCLRRHKACL